VSGATMSRQACRWRLPVKIFHQDIALGGAGTNGERAGIFRGPLAQLDVEGVPARYEYVRYTVPVHVG
jgi:hypothetical protein